MNNKRSDNFDKFSNKKKGSAVKEEYRQEKKKAKVESRAAGEAARQRKKDKERGIIVEPVGNNKRGSFSKKETVSAPPTYLMPLRAKEYPSKATEQAEKAAKYGADKRTAGPRTIAGKKVRTPESMDRADVKRTASIGKVTANTEAPHDQMPLNKFIAHSGISGRREAAELVKAGHVTVNGDTILEPGYKVQYKDVVRLKGKVLQLQVTPV